MQRRTFLKIVGIGGAVGLPLASCQRVGTVAEVLHMPAFLSGVCDEKTLRAIGVAFGKLYPETYVADHIKKELLAVVSLDQSPSAIDPSALASSLAGKVEADFNEGRIITIDGWVLSVTEAKQCALYSLEVQSQ